MGWQRMLPYLERSMPRQNQTPPPGQFILAELEKRGWSQRELAEIIGRPFQLINELIKGKRAVTTDTAVALGAAFGDGAEVWLQRESAHQVAQANVDTDAVQRRARLYEMAPVKEMERRGWISRVSDADLLEGELKRFFGVDSLDDEPKIGAVTRRSARDDSLTPSQRAWCFRVRQLAAAQLVAEYDESRLESCKKALRKVAAYPQETHKVPQVLAAHGIRFAIVEPLAGTKVDGVAMWIDNSPAIGVSLRFDRFDSFWFTLGHEITHIEHQDEAPLDSDLTAATSADDIEALQSVKPPMERRADEGAAAMLIPPAELDSFIRRVGPLYSKDRIVQFANRIKIHPAIVVGQLQHRGEIGYHANREMLSKVKHFVLPTSVTDGWGHTIDQRSVE
jgi:HTH-type transcriptional regulator/antitoxin HigA